MSLIIRKYVNNTRGSSAYGKTYARLVSLGTMNVDNLCAHITSHGSIYTADIVKGVVESFIQCFQHLLLDGYKIKLDGLGTFYLAISTTGEADAKNFSLPSNLKAIRLKFVADQKTLSQYKARAIRDRAHFINAADLAGADSGSGSSDSGGTDGGSDSGTDGGTDGDRP